MVSTTLLALAFAVGRGRGRDVTHLGIALDLQSHISPQVLAPGSSRRGVDWVKRNLLTSTREVLARL